MGDINYRQAIIICLIVVLVYCLYHNYYEKFSINKTVSTVSMVDGYKYRVHQSFIDYDKAVDKLAIINNCMVQLLDSLKFRYLINKNMDETPRRIGMIKTLLKKYNPDNLVENSPEDPSGDTSYSIDKGKTIALCLRDRGQYLSLHQLNDLIFVTIHELTHIAIPELNHPKEFWASFKFLLIEAEIAKIHIYNNINYRNINYQKYPIIYCGLKLNSNPRFDDSILNI